jgi:hypothetical protein
MVDASPPFFDAEISPNDQYHFENASAFDGWLRDIKGRWNRLLSIEDRKVPSPIRPFYVAARNAINKTLAACARLLKDQTPEAVAALRQNLQELATNNRLSLNQPGLPEFLSKLEIERGIAVAAAALAHFAGRQNGFEATLSDPDARLGLAAVTEFLLGGSRASDGAADRVKDQAATGEATLLQLHQRVGEFDQSSKEILQTINQKAEEGQAARSKAVGDLIAKVRDDAATAIGTIEATNAAFTEQMHLQAPVEYWSRKAKSHRKSERSIRGCLVGYTVVGAYCSTLWGRDSLQWREMPWSREIFLTT